LSFDIGQDFASHSQEPAGSGHVLSRRAGGPGGGGGANVGGANGAAEAGAR